MQATIALISSSRSTLAWARARLASLRIIAGVRHLCSRVIAAIDPCRLPVPVPIPARVPRGHLAALAIFATLPVTLALGAVTTAQAWNDPSGFENSAQGRLVDVQVLVDGRAMPLYTAPGKFDRRYFQAFKGRSYALAVRNTTGRRIGVLISVDGLNVVSGERSGQSGREPMYVLDPYERTVIRGWRSSLQDIRKFVFVDEERSYAERTGQANGDMGWIRVLAFRERETIVWRDDIHQLRDGQRPEREDGAQPYDSREESRGTPAPSAPEGGARARQQAGESKLHADRQNEGNESSPGTGWGEQRWDPVRRVWFDPASRPTDQMVLRYEYASGLRALGIYIRGNRLWERERGELGFAQPPRW